MPSEGTVRRTSLQGGEAVYPVSVAAHVNPVRRRASGNTLSLHQLIHIGNVGSYNRRGLESEVTTVTRHLAAHHEARNHSSPSPSHPQAIHSLMPSALGTPDAYALLDIASVSFVAIRWT